MDQQRPPELADIILAQQELRQRLAVLDERIRQLQTREKLAVLAQEPMSSLVPSPPVPLVRDRLQELPPQMAPAASLLPSDGPMAPAVAGTPTIPPPAGAGDSTMWASGESIEMRLGTYWLVRIGILMVLTGLVFLGNYVYHRHIANFGPGGKLALLALAGAALTGAGVWLERWREEMKNYGRVVLAGGLAALYYTAYAAHFVTPLRVIDSPVAGGALLLVVAAAIVWLAERRRVQVLAVLVVLFSFYTGAMNPLQTFSLFSNVLLCGVAAFFLVRRDWQQVSWAGLIGSHLSFGFWRMYQEGGFVWGTGLPADQFFLSRGFLLTCWLLFTLAAFAGGGKRMLPGARASFLTFNNGAFFAYTALGLQRVLPQHYWLFCAIFGAVLVILSKLSRRLVPADRVSDAALLAQGLGVLTLALFGKVTGYQLPLCLAVESVLLLWFAGRVTALRELYWTGAALTGLIALALGLENWSPMLEAGRQWSLLGLAGIFAAGSGVARWSRGRQHDTNIDWPAALYAAAMALCGALALPWLYRNTLSLWPVALGTAALVVALSVTLHWSRMLEAGLASRGWLVVAAFVMLAGGAEQQYWHWVVMTLALVAAAVAWRHGLPASAPHWWHWVAGGDLLMALLIHLGWCERVLPPSWMIPVMALHALAFALLGWWRRWFGLLMLSVYTIAVSELRLLADATALSTQSGGWMVPAVLLAAVPLGRRVLKSEELPRFFPRWSQGACVVLAALSALLLAADQSPRPLLTPAWTGLAFVFFGLGFALRERAARLAGLGLLGAALVRVFARDVWQLDTLGRILSFLVLGGGLLAFGFIYNRFRDRIAKWL